MLEATLTFGEALARLRLPECVASSGPPEKISATASIAPVCTTNSRRIFSPPTQVSHGKPAPDLFLFAAEQMKAAPANCLVIEDSVAGVTGGHAAGMTVLGFHGGSHCQPGHGEKLHAAGAAMTFDDMRRLPDLIARVGRKAD